MTQSVLAGRPPAIAPFSVITSCFVGHPEFEIEQLTPTERVDRDALVRVLGAPRSFNIETVRYIEGGRSIEYEFHGEPVEAIVMNGWPRRELLRVLRILEDLGPFFVFDPQTGEFLSPDDL